MNKLFFIAITLVFCMTLSNDSTSSFSYVIASASAFAGEDYVLLSTYASADEIEVGGYYLTCTGKPDKSDRYIGSISVREDNCISPKEECEVSSSIGGMGNDGVGYQDYDHDNAG